MFRRTLDFFVRPQVTKFVHRTALRLDREEILCGAQGAAIAVNNALGSALRGDSTPLDEISQSGAVDAELHAALMDEVRRGQQYAPDIGEAMNARELQLDELARQRQAISGTARLHDLVLIVGGRRNHFYPFGMYQLKVGSSLVVLSEQPSGLWRADVQRELLLREGCSVQCTVAFAEPREGAPDQLYTFEAAVDGEQLVSGAADLEDTSFVLTDMNGLGPGGGRFWRMATEVSLW